MFFVYVTRSKISVKVLTAEIVLSILKDVFLVFSGISFAMQKRWTLRLHSLANVTAKIKFYKISLQFIKIFVSNACRGTRMFYYWYFMSENSWACVFVFFPLTYQLQQPKVVLPIFSFLCDTEQEVSDCFNYRNCCFHTHVFLVTSEINVVM